MKKGHHKKRVLKTWGQGGIARVREMSSREFCDSLPSVVRSGARSGGVGLLVGRFQVRRRLFQLLLRLLQPRLLFQGRLRPGLLGVTKTLILGGGALLTAAHGRTAPLL